MGIPNRSKIPLRGIGKLFTHLPAGVRAKLESAFQEAESQINYHNRSAVDLQERRRLSSYVSAPVITLTQNSRGFDVSWPRLNDRLISVYEVQVSLTSNFADATVYNLSETSLSVEGVGSTLYVRVRGVRWDGDTGGWSNTEVMNSTTGGPITYSRGLDDVDPFYVADLGLPPYPKPIQFLRITPLRRNGGMVIFGSVTTNFGISGTPDESGPIEVTLDGVLVTSGDSGGFGPVFVDHTTFYFGTVTPRTPGDITATGSHGSAGAHTPWTVGANPSVYTIAFGLASSPQNATSKDLDFSEYGFSIPEDNIITGIEVTYTATDSNNPSTGYASADIRWLKLLDAGVARADKVSLPEWGSSAKVWGSRTDLWNEAAGYWTPSKINDPGFGVRIRGKMFAPAAGATRSISLTWPTITVYSENETTGEEIVDIQVRVNYDSGSLTACTLNVIEFGDAL